jgi:Sec7-like guanine-nucleotide exchange factor
MISGPLAGTVIAMAVQEEYADMRIDEALRKLLREFKLPGEAQQIDRIMEKFAEAYCKHNPGVFTAAEDAYRLAFAIIMLNTDVHNPLADHMLSKQTFVDMNSDVDEDGKAVPALPVDELHCIFDRVSAQVCPLCNLPSQKAGFTTCSRSDHSSRRNPLSIRFSWCRTHHL